MNSKIDLDLLKEAGEQAGILFKNTPVLMMPFIASCLMVTLEKMRESGQVDASESLLSALWATVDKFIIMPSIESCPTCRSRGKSPSVGAMYFVIDEYFKERGHFRKSLATYMEGFRQIANPDMAELARIQEKVATRIAEILVNIIKAKATTT